MKWMSLNEAKAEVLATTGSQLETLNKAVHAKGSRHFAIPKDSGRKSALAALLSSEFLAGGKCWVHVYDEDVFEREGNSFIFALAREAMKERRPLWKAPVCRIEEGEAQYAEAIMALAMFFVWSARLYLPDQTHLLISHDEFLAFNYGGNRGNSATADYLTEFGLEEWEAP
jgi:hypothetical protein